MAKFKALLRSMGSPDPFRLRYREHLGEALRAVVASGKTLTQALEALHIQDDDRQAFEELLRFELDQLATYNCARYRLSIGMTEAWIAKGRPV
jgi:hypothetical protein